MRRMTAILLASVMMLLSLAGCQKPVSTDPTNAAGKKNSKGGHGEASIVETPADHGDETLPNGGDADSQDETAPHGGDADSQDETAPVEETKNSENDSAEKETNAQAADEVSLISTKDLRTITTLTVTESIKDITFEEALLDFINSRVSGNYMVSPLSFRYALGLLLAGTEGQTKTELLTALGVENEEEWNTYCETFNGFVQWFMDGYEDDQEQQKKGISGGWLEPSTELPYRALRVANSVWKRADLPDLKEGYKARIEKVYAAEYADFTAKNAVSRINSWADRKTEHMIPSLLPDGYDTSSMEYVLMNALYFKDSWVDTFSEGATYDDIFYAKNGTNTTKSYMTQSGRYTYYQDADTQIVTIPMAGGVYMTFVIGDTENLSEKMAKGSHRTGRVTIPKLDLETSLSGGEFVDFLKSRGATTIFSDQADLSRMTDRQVHIGDIVQKTRIKLDEDGVEAAAVTGIIVYNSVYDPSEPFVFTADRPFHFYIHTTVNNAMTALLFAGEIVE